MFIPRNSNEVIETDEGYILKGLETADNRQLVGVTPDRIRELRAMDDEEFEIELRRLWEEPHNKHLYCWQ